MRKANGSVQLFFRFLLILLAISITFSAVTMIEIYKSRNNLNQIKEELQESRKFRIETKKFLDKLNIESDPMTVTYYAPFDNKSGICNDGDPFHTATGTLPGPGTFAVNPDVIPYHSNVYILYKDGRIERGRALDTGSAIRASRSKIDSFRWTYKQAMIEGVKEATVLWTKT